MVVTMKRRRCIKVRSSPDLLSPRGGGEAFGHLPGRTDPAPLGRPQTCLPEHLAGQLRRLRRRGLDVAQGVVEAEPLPLVAAHLVERQDLHSLHVAEIGGKLRRLRQVHSGRYCSGLGAGAWLVPCLVSRFTCRHSARVFSSPALHACFAARPPARLSRRSSRRSMPCVWAYAGATPASIRTAAKTPRPRRKLISRCMLPPLVRRSFGRQTLEQEQTLEQQAGPPCSIGSLREVRSFPPMRERRGLRFRELRSEDPEGGPAVATGQYTPSEIGHHVTRRTDPARDGLACGLDAMDERYERRRRRRTHHGDASAGGADR